MKPARADEGGRAAPVTPGAFEDAVRAVVASLGPGELASYGEVAREAGRPGAARAVGQVMARSDGLAWWRVVYADGRLPAGKEELAAAHLRAEGHRVRGHRVMA